MILRFASFCMVFGLLLTPTLASQVTADLTAEQEARYEALIAELRCLVCQNQNIAESHAPLAQDLREQVLDMIAAGKTDTEIKVWLVDRYGDFVLYRPPFKPSTWLLWGSPFLLLAIGLLIAWRIVTARRASVDTAAPSREELERALHEDDPS